MEMINKSSVLIFIVGSYLFSWIFWLPLVVMELEGFTKTFMFTLGGFGPLFAAITVVKISKDKGNILSWLKTIFYC